MKESELLRQLAEDLRREALHYDTRCGITTDESECNGCRARMLREIADRLHHTSYTLDTHANIRYLSINH